MNIPLSDKSTENSCLLYIVWLSVEIRLDLCLCVTGCQRDFVKKLKVGWSAVWFCWLKLGTVMHMLVGLNPGWINIFSDLMCRLCLETT